MREITFLRNLIVLVALLIGSGSAMGQGTETFENHALSGTSYVNGSFVGNNSITWTYVQVTGEQSYPIENKGILLRRSDAPSSIKSSLISGGIGSFSVQMRKAFTGTGDRQVALYINENFIANSQTFGALTGADETIHTFSVSDINIEGDFTIEVRHITGNTANRQLVIDNLTWTAYSSGGNPVVVTPTFDPIAGTYYSTQNVTISTTTDGATIRYTTNGDDPTESSSVYSDPIGVTSTTTIKAKAYKTDMDPSEVASAVYTIVTTPTITVTEETVPAMSAVIGNTDTENITVSGANLTGNITLAVTGTNASLFTLSTSSIAPTEGSVTDQSVTITYTPTATGSHTATLTLSSSGADDVVRTLSGNASEIPNVIISEVYGGGGNSGATYTHDFVELYNTTENSVEIGGWSVQYYSATGTTPGSGPTYNMIIIPEGKYIPAYGHFLIKAASGGTVGIELPTADVTGPDASGNNFNAAATSGKTILFTTNTAQTISDISSITGNANFKDYVPYGTTAVPVWGSAMSSNASATLSATRNKVEGVYVYTQNIGNDFEVVSPNPQNTGLSTATNQSFLTSSIFAHNSKIHLSATAGEPVEVYNAVGQKVISTLATDGQNVLNVREKGVMIVKVGDRIAKVIL